MAWWAPSKADMRSSSTLLSSRWVAIMFLLFDAFLSISSSWVEMGTWEPLCVSNFNTSAFFFNYCILLLLMGGRNAFNYFFELLLLTTKSCSWMSLLKLGEALARTLWDVKPLFMRLIRLRARFYFFTRDCSTFSSDTSVSPYSNLAIIWAYAPRVSCFFMRRRSRLRSSFSYLSGIWS